MLLTKAIVESQALYAEGSRAKNWQRAGKSVLSEIKKGV